MPNDREKLIIKLKGFDAAHYRRTEAYARQIEKLCNLAASEYASLAGTVSARPKQAVQLRRLPTDQESSSAGNAGISEEDTGRYS